jgi:DNA-binding IclR family transcriptional regulator
LVLGFKLLEKVAEAGEPLTLGQVAEAMQMTLPTAYRFLYTLQAINMIEKEPHRKAYRITPKVLKLGYGVFKSSELWNTAHPHLVRASQKYGETFNLAILERDRILYIDRIKTQSILTINLEIGSRQQVMVPAVLKCAERISSAMGFFNDENLSTNDNGS